MYNSMLQITNPMSTRSTRTCTMTNNRKCTKTLSKAPCLVALRMSLTLHLLLFRQSMWVLIGIGIKYLILMKGKICSIEDQDNKLLGLFGFLKIKIVCKDDVFLAFKATNEKNCTRVYRTTITNGIDCCNNQTLLIGVATTHFDWMGLTCYI